jgi:hypothetical protein
MFLVAFADEFTGTRRHEFVMKKSTEMKEQSNGIAHYGQPKFQQYDGPSRL